MRAPAAKKGKGALKGKRPCPMQAPEAKKERSSSADGGGGQQVGRRPGPSYARSTATSRAAALDVVGGAAARAIKTRNSRRRHISLSDSEEESVQKPAAVSAGTSRRRAHAVETAVHRENSVNMCGRQRAGQGNRVEVPPPAAPQSRLGQNPQLPPPPSHRSPLSSQVPPPHNPLSGPGPTFPLSRR